MGTRKAQIINFFATRIRKYRTLVKLLNVIAKQASPETVVVFDYPLNPKRRWDPKNPHHELYDIINRSRAAYTHHLQSFLTFEEYFIKIPKQQTSDSPSTEPCWINGWMSALDGVALYSFIVLNKPKYYIEVGSGNSTKFARRAITDHKLDTKITSIDPCPRADVDGICDEIIREPVENVNLEIFDRLDANDILYIDGSHRVFMNSDAIATSIDVIPRLKPGVLVEIHDILLPYDYPAEWTDKYYAEQYLLAAYLLAKGNRFDIVLPNMFISNDNELKRILSPLWGKKEMEDVDTQGDSFWLRIK